MRRLFAFIFLASVFTIGCTHVTPTSNRQPSSVETRGEGNIVVEVPSHPTLHPYREFQKLSDLAVADKAKDNVYGLNSKLKEQKLSPGQSPSFLATAHNFASPNKKISDIAAALPKELGVVTTRPAESSITRSEVMKKSGNLYKQKNKRFSPEFKKEAQARTEAIQFSPKPKRRQPNQVSGCLATYDDYYEGNDTRSAAYDLSGDEGYWLSSIDGRGVQFDDDYYEIFVSDSYRKLIVDLRHNYSCSDIDLAVYDSSGSQVARSASSGDDEYISIELARGGTYYVRAYYGDDGGYYDLKWSTLYTGATEDAYEDNDGKYSAYDLRGWENRWLSSLYGVGVAKDDDYYEIQVDQGYLRVTVDVRFYHQYGDIDLKLENSSGYTVASSTSSSDDEYIDFVVSAPGIYYLRVYPAFYSSNANVYDLKWYLSQTGPVWTEDSYEPNDSLSLSYNIGLGQTINANQFDEDWFKFTVSDTQRHLQIQSTFTNADGDIDIRLYDGGYYQLASSTSGYQDRENIDFTVGAPGTYYVSLSGQNKGNPYYLTVNALASGRTDDVYEPNDSLAAATDLTLKDGVWLSNIQGTGMLRNDDYYKIYINPDMRHLYVDCRFSEGNIDLELLSSSGQIIAFSRGTTSNELIEFAVNNVGQTYYIRVLGSNSGQSYDLKWTAKPITLPSPPPTGQVNVIEYYNTKFKHYFLTAVPAEAANLDSGALPGWFRTGYSFRAFGAPSGGLNPVCRFFGNTAIGGPNSHFYTANPQECQKVKTELPLWKFEEISFYIGLPNNETCPANTVPVYRMYNNGQNGEANHRYLININERAFMESQGWMLEGKVFCSPL